MSYLGEALRWLLDGGNWAGAGGIWARVGEHLLITLAAVALAAIIAVPTGALIGHFGRGAALVGGLAGALRAVPTLGLLTLVALWLGIGAGPPLLALVVLAIPSLLAGAYGGVAAVPGTARQTARALGMTGWQVFWRLEAPLALPVAMGGLRAAVLQVVATATLAAYTADVGLGRFLLTGLAISDFGMMLGGAAVVIAVALLLELALGALQRRARAFADPVAVKVAVGQLDGAPSTSRFASAPLRGNPGAPSSFESKERGRSWLTPAVILAAVTALFALATFSRPSAGIYDTVAPRPGGALVIGSQAYYSNEIIAEIWAQALEAEGFTVDRQFNIGQRNVYLPLVEAGAIDLFPEYSGNLLQFWRSDTEARTSADVFEALVAAAPPGLRILEQSPATDQDTYTVTRVFAEEWDLRTLADLSRVTVPLVLGGNPEIEFRPYGPAGLYEAYGVAIGFTPIGDSGGPLTVAALQSGQIQLANMFSASPAIAINDLVVLEDPLGLFLASHVVPIASDRVPAEAEAIINRISAAMSPYDLVALNARSVVEQLPASTIATDWLATHPAVN